MARRIPNKNRIKKFDFTGTGRGPMMVPRRVTGGPAKRPSGGMTKGGGGGVPRYPAGTAKKKAAPRRRSK